MPPAMEFTNETEEETLKVPSFEKINPKLNDVEYNMKKKQNNFVRSEPTKK